MFPLCNLTHGWSIICAIASADINKILMWPQTSSYGDECINKFDNLMVILWTISICRL